MTVAYFFDMPQVDHSTAMQVAGYIRDALGPAPPDGAVFHAEGPGDAGGWWSFNLWESETAFRDFYDAYIVPAATRAGLDAPGYRRLEVAWDTSQTPEEAAGPELPIKG